MLSQRVKAIVPVKNNLGFPINEMVPELFNKKAFQAVDMEEAE